MKTLNEQTPITTPVADAYTKLSDLDDLQSFVHRLSNNRIGIVQYHLDYDGKSVLMKSVLRKSINLQQHCSIAEIPLRQTASFNREHGLKSVPSLILIQSGRVVQQHTGLLSRTRLKTIIDNIHPLSLGQTG